MTETKNLIGWGILVLGIMLTLYLASSDIMINIAIAPSFIGCILFVIILSHEKRVKA